MPIIQLPPFQNVGAALTAVLPAINQGWTYEKIWFRLGGTTFAKNKISALRLILGGKKIWEVTGAHLDLINNYYKQVSTGDSAADARHLALRCHASRIAGVVRRSAGDRELQRRLEIERHAHRRDLSAAARRGQAHASVMR